MRNSRPSEIQKQPISSQYSRNFCRSVRILHQRVVKCLSLMPLITDAFDNPAVFDAEIQNNPAIATFKPPGELVQSYFSQGRAYEIWCGELTDPTVRLLLERLQIFTSFFIEGGTPIYLDDEQWTLARWRVFFVYVHP